MKTKSTIAYVHTGIWPSKSPSTTFVTYNALALANHFENVILFVKRGSHSTSVKILNDYFQITQPANLTIIQTLVLFRKLNLVHFAIVFFTLFSKRARLIAIVTRNVRFLPWLVHFKKRYGIKAFYESHDFFADLSLSGDKITKRKLHNSQLENKYIPGLTGIICLQEAQKALYHKCFPATKIYVLRTGIHQIIETDIQAKKYIAYIGSFDTHKGLDTFIEAAAKTKTQPEILLIGGKSDEEIAVMNKLADKYGYKDKLTITKWINKQEMSVYLSQIRIGVVPVNDTFFNRHITSPLKIFDYYSHCIPIIASDLPTTRELIEDGLTGMFIPSNNVTAFADIIDKMFDDAELYNVMVKNIREKAMTLLWDSRAIKLKHIIMDAQ